MIIEIFIVIVIMLILIYIYFTDFFKRWFNDLSLIWFYRKKNRWENFVNANQQTVIKDYPLKICFVSMDDRNDEFINLHNANILQYCEINNKLNINRTYTYKKYKFCPLNCQKHNVYWCKFYLLEYLLSTNYYDYVVWIDSDAVITNLHMDLGDILLKYNSDIFLPIDNINEYRILNSGICIVKNSEMGNKIIQMINSQSETSNFQNRCFSEKKITGLWSLSCFEQGIMNKTIWDYYLDYLTILPPNIILCAQQCSYKSTFIIHLLAESSEKRKLCFQQIFNS